MTPRERLDALLSGRPVDRPPFFPAVYDLKATLADVPPHLFGQSENELVLALEREVSEFSTEALTCAYDIYNVEAEALGGTLRRDASLGLPDLDEVLIRNLDALPALPPLPAGRMALFAGAAKVTHHKFGGSIPVRGGITGPFSMAAKIFPREELLMHCVTDPEAVSRLLAFCNGVAKGYASLFLAAGVDVAVFDSFIAPPMMSPDLYRELVLPLHRDLFAHIKNNGGRWRTLIAGGNTLPLYPALAESGANQFLLDYVVPLPQAAELMAAHPGLLFRYNLSPALVARATPGSLRATVRHTVTALKDRPNFILGTGVLPPDTPPINILAARQALLEFYGIGTR